MLQSSIADAAEGLRLLARRSLPNSAPGADRTPSVRRDTASPHRALVFRSPDSVPSRGSSSNSAGIVIPRATIGASPSSASRSSRSPHSSAMVASARRKRARPRGTSPSSSTRTTRSSASASSSSSASSKSNGVSRPPSPSMNGVDLSLPPPPPPLPPVSKKRRTLSPVSRLADAARKTSLSPSKKLRSPDERATLLTAALPHAKGIKSAFSPVFPCPALPSNSRAAPSANGTSPLFSPHSAPLSGQGSSAARNGVYLSTRAHKRKFQNGGPLETVVGALSPPNKKMNAQKSSSSARGGGNNTRSAPLTAALPRSGSSSMPHLDLSTNSDSPAASTSSSHAGRSPPIDLTAERSGLVNGANSVSSAFHLSNGFRDQPAISSPLRAPLFPRADSPRTPPKDKRRRLTRKKGYSPAKRVNSCPKGISSVSASAGTPSLTPSTSSASATSSRSSASATKKSPKAEKDHKSPQLASSGSSASPPSPDLEESTSSKPEPEPVASASAVSSSSSSSASGKSSLRRRPPRGWKPLASETPGQTVRGESAGDAIPIDTDSECAPETQSSSSSSRDSSANRADSSDSAAGGSVSPDAVRDESGSAESNGVDAEVSMTDDADEGADEDAGVDEGGADAEGDDADDMWDDEDDGGEVSAVSTRGKEDIIDESSWKYQPTKGWKAKNLKCMFSLKPTLENIRKALVHSNREVIAALLLDASGKLNDFGKKFVSENRFEHDVDPIGHPKSACFSDCDKKMRLIHYAMHVSSPRFVEFLLDHCHCTIRMKDEFDRTALHHAVLRVDEDAAIELLQILKERGDSFMAISQFKMSALHYAAHVPSPRVAEFVLQNSRLTPNLTDTDGNTPLSHLYDDFFGVPNWVQRVHDLVSLMYDWKFNPKQLILGLTVAEWFCYFVSPTPLRALTLNGEDVFRERNNNLMNNLAKKRHAGDVKISPYQSQTALIDLLAEGVWRSVQNGDFLSLARFGVVLRKRCPSWFRTCSTWNGPQPRTEKGEDIHSARTSLLSTALDSPNANRLVKKLLEFGCVPQESEKEEALLNRAIYRSDIDTVSSLLAHYDAESYDFAEARTTSVDVLRGTEILTAIPPLFMCVMARDEESRPALLRRLQRLKPDLMTQTAETSSLLHWASLRRQPVALWRMMKKIQRLGRRPNRMGCLPAHYLLRTAILEKNRTAKVKDTKHRKVKAALDEECFAAGFEFLCESGFDFDLENNTGTTVRSLLKHLPYLQPLAERYMTKRATREDEDSSQESTAPEGDRALSESGDEAVSDFTDEGKPSSDDTKATSSSSSSSSSSAKRKRGEISAADPPESSSSSDEGRRVSRRTAEASSPSAEQRHVVVCDDISYGLEPYPIPVHGPPNAEIPRFKYILHNVFKWKPPVSDSSPERLAPRSEEGSAKKKGAPAACCSCFDCYEQKEECPCILANNFVPKSGGNPKPPKGGYTRKSFLSGRQTLSGRIRTLVSCHDGCDCMGKCGLRFSQLPLQYHLEVFHTPNRGYCCRTQEKIRRGSPIHSYMGEVISLTESYQRDAHNETIGSNYMFMEADAPAAVDSAHRGNVTRFISHACQPNCAQKLVYGADREFGVSMPELVIFALKDIPPGTELTMNYGYDRESVWCPDLVIECRCGSAKCSHILQ